MHSKYCICEDCMQQRPVPAKRMPRLRSLDSMPAEKRRFHIAQELRRAAASGVQSEITKSLELAEKYRFYDDPRAFESMY